MRKFSVPSRRGDHRLRLATWLRITIATIVGVAALGIASASASAALVTVTLDGSAKGAVTSDPPGIDCSNVPGAEATDCSFDFPFDFASGVKLSAVGAAGAAFKDWTGTAGGTCSGSVNPCETAPIALNPLGAIATFAPTPDKPSVSTGAVSDVAFPSAVLSGTVNPNSADFSISDCYFEYGTSTEYGMKDQCHPGPPGPGTAAVSVTGRAGMLASGTTYHYRVVAVSAGGTSVGEDQTFTSAAAPADSCPNAAIRAEQGPIAQRLPDCYAYELVSPQSTAGQEPIPQAIGGTGEDVMFGSGGGFADVGNLMSISAMYRSHRTEAGWATEALGGPAAAEYPFYSVDVDWEEDWWRHDRPLSLWGAVPKAVTSTSGLRTMVSGYKYGPWQEVAPLLEADASIFATAADLSGVLVAAGPTAKPTLTDGTTDTRTANGNTFAVIKRRQDGTFDARQVGRTNGGETLHPSCSLSLGGTAGSVTRGAVNRDGLSRIVFTTGGQGACRRAAQQRVYVAEPFSSNPDAVDISASRCTLGAPACGNAATVQFVGGSKDASRLFMMTTQRLVDEDVHAGADLYEYDFRRAPEDRLQLVSSGPAPAQVQGVVAVSDSGSHVYFVANGALDHVDDDSGEPTAGARNLYVRILGAVGEPATTRFVATLDAGDSNLWAFPIFAQSALTPDGRFLAFTSVARLTAADQDSMPDVYRYDAEGGDLRRAWPEDPAANGLSRTAGATLNPSATWVGGEANFGRKASTPLPQIADDGSAIGFTTVEAMAPGDVNGADDAFVWTAATDSVAMISDGKDARGVEYVGVSADGKTHLFTTTSRITREHTATSVGLYAVRQSGGFPVPEAPAAPCAGEACQGPPSGSPLLAGVGSTTFAGSTNVVPPGEVPPAGNAKVRVSKVKTVRGTSIRVKVRVPGKGKIRTSGSGLKRATKSVKKAGTYRVTVRLSKRAKRTLRRKDRVKVRVTVRFTPAKGKAQRVRVHVTFKSKAKKHRKSSSRAARQVSVPSAADRRGR